MRFHSTQLMLIVAPKSYRCAPMLYHGLRLNQLSCFWLPRITIYTLSTSERFSLQPRYHSIHPWSLPSKPAPDI